MEEALQLIKKSPEKAMSALLADAASRKQIVKKVSKMLNKGKIMPNVVLQSKTPKHSQKTPQRSCASATPKRAQKIPKHSRTSTARGAVWKLELRSPAIESRVQAYPYDDTLMCDFGDLAEYFYDGGQIDELHKSQKKRYRVCMGVR
mmetsp:Transcript_148177/g.283970  ORF Transcript_148177/g.283970 Transcript_148177/m.283970 type:complete len:147 (-) Transcript_148177:222-662(-)